MLYPYLVTPEQAISNHTIFNTNGRVSTIINKSAPLPIAELISQSTVFRVFVNADSGDGFITVDGNYSDYNNLRLLGEGSELNRKVAAQCRQTMVLLHAGVVVVVSNWQDNEDVITILWAGPPCQESGDSLVDILYGALTRAGSCR